MIFPTFGLDVGNSKEISLGILSIPLNTVMKLNYVVMNVVANIILINQKINKHQNQLASLIGHLFLVLINGPIT